MQNNINICWLRRRPNQTGREAVQLGITEGIVSRSAQCTRETRVNIIFRSIVCKMRKTYAQLENVMNFILLHVYTSVLYIVCHFPFTMAFFYIYIHLI